MTTLELAQYFLTLGLSPLPVARAQDPEQYPARDKNGHFRRDKHGKLVPAFTGKNPSFLDKNGVPRLINHREFQNKRPSKNHIKLWFANPLNGIGCLGSKHHRFVDIDAKHFATKQECNRLTWDWISKHPVLEGAQVEKIQSGGFRLWVEFETPPDFTNFAFSEGGPHIGEILGEGRFAVLAPTIGPLDKVYKVIQEGGFAKIESAAAIGLYSTAAKKVKTQMGWQHHPHHPQKGLRIVWDKD